MIVIERLKYWVENITQKIEKKTKRWKIGCENWKLRRPSQKIKTFSDIRILEKIIMLLPTHPSKVTKKLSIKNKDSVAFQETGNLTSHEEVERTPRMGRKGPPRISLPRSGVRGRQVSGEIFTHAEVKWISYLINRSVPKRDQTTIKDVRVNWW